MRKEEKKNSPLIYPPLIISIVAMREELTLLSMPLSVRISVDP